MTCMQSFAVTVTWNGTIITDVYQVLIYHDELLTTDTVVSLVTMSNLGNTVSSAGVLLCVSDDHRQVDWYNAGGSIVPEASSGDHFRQYRAMNQLGQSTSYLTLGVEIVNSMNASINGVWTCRISGFPISNIAIYSRGKCICRIQ